MSRGPASIRFSPRKPSKKYAQVKQEAEVKKLLFDGDRMSGVAYEQGGQLHEAKARYVVDASGRTGLIARHFGLRRINPRLRNIAFYNHYHNCDWEKNASGEGYQVLAMHKDGWIWCIPVGPARSEHRYRDAGSADEDRRPPPTLR